MNFLAPYSDNTDINVLASAEDKGILSAPSGTGSLTDLKNLIDGSGNEITLDSNYEYRAGDSRTGINITKDLIINGNGATINGWGGDNNPVTIFNISVELL